MAKGVHLFPSRTQKLSPYTSKVLGWKRPGRIDSCRLEKQPVPMVQVVFLFVDIYRTGRGPGCPATAFEGAKRRSNALVARRVVSKLCLLTTEDR